MRASDGLTEAPNNSAAFETNSITFNNHEFGLAEFELPHEFGQAELMM